MKDDIEREKVNKILRSLHKDWDMKVMAIIKGCAFSTCTIDQLRGSLIVCKEKVTFPWRRRGNKYEEDEERGVEVSRLGWDKDIIHQIKGWWGNALMLQI